MVVCVLKNPLIWRHTLSIMKNRPKNCKRITTDSISKSRWVTLKRQMPVYITYYTTWLDDEGKIVTYPDIYGYDPRLKEALKKYWTN
jgi:murein L,D-transpeptidase YcbB/YkuD